MRWKPSKMELCFVRQPDIPYSRHYINLLYPATAGTRGPTAFDDEWQVIAFVPLSMWNTVRSYR